MNSVNIERIMVALWFAVAGFVPAVAAFTTFSEFTFLSYILFLALPIMFAGISGYTIGYPITQEEKVRTQNQGAIRGFFVSIVSYLFLGLGIVIAIAIRSWVNPIDLPREFQYWLAMAGIVVAGLLIFFPIYFFGQFALLLISGSFAGWFLFNNRSNIQKLLISGSLVILPIGIFILWSLPDPNNIPIYPNAENIQYGDFGITDSGTAEEKVISFHTSDSFDMVLDYYEKQLIKDGWNRLRRSDTTLEVYSPSENYRVRIEKDSDSEKIQIKLWHSTLFSFL